MTPTTQRGRPPKPRERAHDIRRNVRLTEDWDAKLIAVAEAMDIPPEVLIRHYVVKALADLDRAARGIDRRRAS